MSKRIDEFTLRSLRDGSETIMEGVVLDTEYNDISFVAHSYLHGWGLADFKSGINLQKQVFESLYDALLCGQGILEEVGVKNYRISIKRGVQVFKKIQNEN